MEFSGFDWSIDRKLCEGWIKKEQTEEQNITKYFHDTVEMIQSVTTKTAPKKGPNVLNQWLHI